MYPGGNQRTYTSDVNKKYSGNSGYDLSGVSFLRNGTSPSVYQSTPKSKKHNSYLGVETRHDGLEAVHNHHLGISPSAVINSNAYTPGMRVSSPPKPMVSFGSASVIGKPSSPVHGGQVRSPSPVRSPIRSWSPTKFSDVEMSTIQKQRKELQLLIGELKDRDRELNEMVASHQKQLVAWESDRQRALMLEKLSSKLKAELRKRVEQVKYLREKVKTAESEGNSKSKELEDTQLHLQQISEQANVSTQQVQELQERNENLAGSVQELSSSLGQLQAREQELETVLKLKVEYLRHEYRDLDSDIREANIRISEVTQKIKKLQGLLQESKRSENSMKLERDQYREQLLTNKNELERLKADVNKQATDTGEHQAELSQVKQETLVLQKELFLAGEREKRKDQLLELAKSKQERTETELQHLRQLYERQQRDLMFLQHQVQTQDGTDMFDRFSEITTDDESSVVMSRKDSTTNKGMLLFSDPESNLTDQERNLDINDIQSIGEFVDMPDVFKGNIGGKTLPSLPHLSNSDVETDVRKSLGGNFENVSPTSRLHRLLEESKKMVQTLEDPTPLSSTQTTPEQIKLNSKGSPGKESEKSSPNVTLGSFAMKLNGYCSDSSN